MLNSTKKETPKHRIGYPALEASMVELLASRFSRAVFPTQAQAPTLEPLTALVESHGETFCLPQAPDPLPTIQSLLGSLSECLLVTDYSHQHGDCTPVPQQFASLFSSKVNTQDFQASVTALLQGSDLRVWFLDSSFHSLVPNLKDLVSTYILSSEITITNSNLSSHNKFKNRNSLSTNTINKRNSNESTSESHRKKRNSKRKKKSNKKSKMGSKSTLIGRYLKNQTLSSRCRGRQKTHIFGGRRLGVCGERVRVLKRYLDVEELSVWGLKEKKSGWSLDEKTGVQTLGCRSQGFGCRLEFTGSSLGGERSRSPGGSLGWPRRLGGNREKMAA